MADETEGRALVGFPATFFRETRQMSDRKFGPITRELIAAKKRIENPENWCPAGWGSKGKMCAVHALYVETSNVSDPAIEAQWLALCASSEALFQTNPMRVNDNPALGHAAVMQMYDHAIARAIKEGK